MRVRRAAFKIMNGLSAMIVAGGLAACGGAPPAGESQPAAADLGGISLQLQVGRGIYIGGVDYDIRNASFHTAGHIGLVNSNTISAHIADIPRGVGYVVSLTATEVDPRVTGCSGSTTVAVVPGTDTVANVHLLCREPPLNAEPVPLSPLANLALGTLLLAVTGLVIGRGSRRA